MNHVSEQMSESAEEQIRPVSGTTSARNAGFWRGGKEIGYILLTGRKQKA